MSLKNFLKSRVFLFQFLYSIGILLGLIFITLFILRIYTHHGKSVQVPSFMGLTTSEAMAKGREYNFTIVISDSVHVEKAEPGTIIDQVPEPGMKVKQNRKIFLTINAMVAEEIRMPSVVDVSYRHALVILENSGLIPGNVSYEASEFKDLVLRVRYNGNEIRPGEKINKGRVVDLVLGSGISEPAGENNTSPGDTIF